MTRPTPAAGSARLLVVEDRESLRRLFERALAQAGYTVVALATAEEAISRLQSAGEVDGRGFELVLTDLKLPGLSGLEVVRAARSARPPVPTVVMTAYGTVDAAVEAMRLGAIDFLEKPVDMEELQRRVESVVGPGSGGAAGGVEVFEAPDGTRIVGRHPRLRAALHLLERVAPNDTTVLLLGESGTGKELFARALHALSGRSGKFIALNCAAIPESLLENELFGHEKGAFTGADRRQAGRFEAAEGGTLFLDEVGELPLSVQAKVLRVLEDRVVERIGGGRAERVDVRLVAATNRDLRRLAEEGAYRRDLLYRLDVFPIELVPLRERREDIPLLARAILRDLATRKNRPLPVLEEETLTLLAARPWPGNVRELANVLERALILADGPIRAADLQMALEPMAASEEDRVKEALRDSGGDRDRAAERLGVSPRTLQRRIREFGLEGYPRYGTGSEPT